MIDIILAEAMGIQFSEFDEDPFDDETSFPFVPNYTTDRLIELMRRYMKPEDRFETVFTGGIFSCSVCVIRDGADPVEMKSAGEKLDEAMTDLAHQFFRFVKENAYRKPVEIKSAEERVLLDYSFGRKDANGFFFVSHADHEFARKMSEHGLLIMGSIGSYHYKITPYGEIVRALIKQKRLRATSEPLLPLLQHSSLAPEEETKFIVDHVSDDGNSDGTNSGTVGNFSLSQTSPNIVPSVEDANSLNGSPCPTNEILGADTEAGGNLGEHTDGDNTPLPALDLGNVGK